MAMTLLALSGYAKHILWSFNAGFLYRPAARIGTGVTDDGSTVGSELQLGAAVAYADMQRRFAIGIDPRVEAFCLQPDRYGGENVAVIVDQGDCGHEPAFRVEVAETARNPLMRRLNKLRTNHEQCKLG